MSDGRELELKFEVPPEKVASFRTRSLPHLGGRDGVRERLASVYFDTRKHALNRRGLSLRVREAGERRIQTVKAQDGTGAGLFDRPEWEHEITSEGPDLKAAADTPIAGLLAKRTAADLRPVFSTEVDRTTWTVTTEAAEIEVALDEGRIAADGSARSIVELELELKRGRPADLFALARTLDLAGPLKIGVETKSERGYRLAAGAAAPSAKAEPVRLERGMPSADAIAAIGRACLRHFRLNEALLLESRAPEPLHQARVALRRLRSALSLFRPVVADAAYPGLRRRLRALAALFGEARNLDVYLERSSDPGARPEEVERLRDERERAYDRVVETLGSKRTRRLMLDTLAWLEDGSWRKPDDKKARARVEEPVEAMAARILDRRRRRLRKGGKHLAELDAEGRHQIRIEAKKLRYASEFFAGLAESKKERRRHKSFVAALADVQECLGQLNDLQTGREIEARLGATPPAAAPAADLPPEPIDDRETELLAGAIAAQGAFRAAKPFWRDFA